MQPVILARFFYSYREGELQISHYSMLQSVLYNILNEDESFFYHQFQSKYRDCQAALGKSSYIHWPYNTLKEILLSLHDHSPAVQIYLIIDAVDESDNKDRHDTLKLLFDLCTMMKYCTLKVFIASRPVGELEIRRSKFHNFIRLQDETKSDISRFANSFLDDLNLTHLLTQAVEYIVENAQGVFLWVKLVGEELLTLQAEGCSEENIFEFLKSLPTELEDFYMRMFKKMNQRKRDIQDGVKMFYFILFGKRPLAVSELLHALGIPDNPHAEFEPLDNSFRRRIPHDQRIIHCGGNFLEIQSYHGTNTNFGELLEA